MTEVTDQEVHYEGSIGESIDDDSQVIYSDLTHRVNADSRNQQIQWINTPSDSMSQKRV